ncbi:MAG: cupredoxin domain-containing protein [Gemmatimonadota bacterium]
MRRLAGAVAIVAAPALCAGCGGGAGGVASESPVDTTRVDMPPHYRFDPAAVRVPAGATVTWTNTDDFTHTVRVDTAGAEPHTVSPGDSLRLTFERAGEYDYVCTLHPHDMRGRVVVTEP